MKEIVDNWNNYNQEKRMPDKNGFSVLNEYNNDFACIYSKLCQRFKKIEDYASRLYEAKLKGSLQIISDKIGRNEDIGINLDNLEELIKTKFGKTPELKMPDRSYSYYDEVALYINGDTSRERKERKYDRIAFDAVARGNFLRIDKELGYNFDTNYCVQDACVWYLTMVYDLWGKLQDEIRYYRSAGNRSFGEFLSSMTFGFLSSIGRSFNTYDSTADAYAKFCSLYLLPDYELLFGENGMCTHFNRALKKTEELKMEYKNKSNLIGKNNNKLVFEINGLIQTLTLGEIYLKDYKELEDAFNRNELGIKVNYSTQQDTLQYMAPPNSFIFTSTAPFTFKKESTLLTLIGFEAMDTKSWEVNGKHIMFSRRSVANSSDLDKLRKIQVARDAKKFKDMIAEIGALLKK